MVQIRSFCIVFIIFIEYQNETIYLLIHIVSKWYINHLSRTVYLSIKEMAIILMNQYNQFFKKVVKLSISNLVWYICRSFLGGSELNVSFKTCVQQVPRQACNLFQEPWNKFLVFPKVLKNYQKVMLPKQLKFENWKRKGVKKFVNCSFSLKLDLIKLKQTDFHT